MRSLRPKPLHLLCGRPLLLYVLDALAETPVDRTIVVVGQGAEAIVKRVQEELADRVVDFVEQRQPRGTADALAAALGVLPEDDFSDDDVLVLPGDMPLLSGASVAGLVADHRRADGACTVLSAELEDPAGHSRVVRGRGGRVVSVVSEREATEDQSMIKEVSPGVFCFRRSVLGASLRRLVPDPTHGEFRLGGIVEVLHRAGYPVGSFSALASEVAEVDDRVRLAQVEATLRRRIVEGWLRAGVTMVDPASVYIDAAVHLGQDVALFPNTLLQGRTIIGAGAEIGPDSRLVDCVIGERARVEKSVGRDAEVGADAIVGPFVVLEPGSQIAEGQRVLPFTTVLTYLG